MNSNSQKTLKLLNNLPDCTFQLNAFKARRLNGILFPFLCVQMATTNGMQDNKKLKCSLSNRDDDIPLL